MRRTKGHGPVINPKCPSRKRTAGPGREGILAADRCGPRDACWRGTNGRCYAGTVMVLWLLLFWLAGCANDAQAIREGAADTATTEDLSVSQLQAGDCIASFHRKGPAAGNSAGGSGEYDRFILTSCAADWKFRVVNSFEWEPPPGAVPGRSEIAKQAEERCKVPSTTFLYTGFPSTRSLVLCIEQREVMEKLQQDLGMDDTAFEAFIELAKKSAEEEPTPASALAPARMFEPKVPVSSGPLPAAHWASGGYTHENLVLSSEEDSRIQAEVQFITGYDWSNLATADGNDDAVLAALILLANETGRLDELSSPPPASRPELPGKLEPLDTSKANLMQLIANLQTVANAYRSDNAASSQITKNRLEVMERYFTQFEVPEGEFRSEAAVIFEDALNLPEDEYPRVGNILLPLRGYPRLVALVIARYNIFVAE